MYKTKVTKKGQITLPNEYREKLDISTGSVVFVDIKKEEIVIKKPESNLDELFGKWADVKNEDLKNIRAIWRGWNVKNEKDIRRF